MSSLGVAAGIQCSRDSSLRLRLNGSLTLPIIARECSESVYLSKQRAMNDPSKRGQTACASDAGGRYRWVPDLGSEKLLAVAVDVVIAASRQSPVDRVLRETLRAMRGLRAEDSRVISRAVFAFFRWHGWLDECEPVRARLRRALELAEYFAFRPETFSDDELVERAVPAWAREVMGVSATWVRTIQAEPELWLRARKGQGQVLADRLGKARPASLPDALIYEGEEDLFRRPEFHAGEFEIQDVTSQAVGRACDPKPGEAWWDARLVVPRQEDKVATVSTTTRVTGLVGCSGGCF